MPTPRSSAVRPRRLTRLGAVPVPVDVDAASDNLSAEGLEKAWVRLDRAARARVKAIVLVQGLVTHIYNQLVIRVSRRDMLREFLATRGVGAEIYDRVLLHLQKCLRPLGHREGDFPEADRAARGALALPVYAELTAEQQACQVYAVGTIGEFYRAG